ncbi:hypothetical protein H9X88_05160 [Aeromonas hydrophila]|uniref:hypothetical protein n=1 Tax=Aeromonas hydrophila TaxID=644 RepID=UPI001B39DAAF|nr:hypothetical protein [Aeromonas hydrophila]MBQ4677826.1 hypothetical protein [Aeromonas hydrophila]MBW3814968.1 hypothetical protein [Aeromonas hydrophila]MCF7677522.1 hypothetical protein [Aeromonas hydrophila]MCF7690325.1 hypothetical protein [Aeromonas hydrophila]MCF7775551.1 hypothetical protein [Aeromonas hydrophila]
MKILDYCIKYHAENGRFGEPSAFISQRICHLVNNLVSRKPSETINSHHREGATFNKNYFGDIISIIFEVLVDTNRNPGLWESDELEVEIQHMLKILFFGPMGEINKNINEGVADDIPYLEAKTMFIKYLDKSQNLFSPY